MHINEAFEYIPGVLLCQLILITHSKTVGTLEAQSLVVFSEFAG